MVVKDGEISGFGIVDEGLLWKKSNALSIVLELEMEFIILGMVLQWWTCENSCMCKYIWRSSAFLNIL